MIKTCPFCKNLLAIKPASPNGLFNYFCNKSKNSRDGHYFGYDSFNTNFTLQVEINNEHYRAFKIKNDCIIQKRYSGVIGTIKDCSLNQALEFLKNFQMLS